MVKGSKAVRHKSRRVTSSARNQMMQFCRCSSAGAVLDAVLDAPRRNASWEVCRCRVGPDGCGPKVCPEPAGYNITAVLAYSSSNSFFFCRLLYRHTLSEVGWANAELIILSRMRRRDMARSLDSGVGSSISDSVRLV